jgi:hypothetical protein
MTRAFQKARCSAQERASAARTGAHIDFLTIDAFAAISAAARRLFRFSPHYCFHHFIRYYCHFLSFRWLMIDDAIDIFDYADAFHCFH